MTTALYRRYRPDTFDDVIGQEQVTEPLKAALRAGRVTHAFLFSGPRGCGKTTCARILARCLNCAEGPTDTPCGRCDSCRDLATGGPGSLDVVEIDAASHNGVDDARELRERAGFAPTRDRYKIFILDEAHMVTPQGFNALLKLVEEPPEHVKFIFATTEPDKVLPTIRSRTHHYPFRLVGPGVMIPYLQKICGEEHAAVGEGVLPLVARAGGGSVRDTLSVLDQLIAGSTGGTLDYAHAVALLGYTDQALLDQTVDALAGGDGGAAYRVVERTVDAGHEPRRFVEDLLQRLRDLIVIAVAGDSAADVLVGTPSDQLDRMRVQAKNWGAAGLARAAGLTDQALRTMVGATSPRLQLELLIGRILVPDRAAAQRQPAVATGAPRAIPAAAPARPEVPATTAQRAPATPSASAPRPASTPSAAPAPAEGANDQPAPQPGAAAASNTAAAPSGGPGAADMLRQRWPEVIGALEHIRRATWFLVRQEAQLGAVDERSATLLFPTSGLMQKFESSDHADNVARAIYESVGLRLQVLARVSQDGARGGGAAPSSGEPSRGAEGPADWGAPNPSAGPSGGERPAAQHRPGGLPASAFEPPPFESGASGPAPASPRGGAAAPEGGSVPAGAPAHAAADAGDPPVRREPPSRRLRAVEGAAAVVPGAGEVAVPAAPAGSTPPLRVVPPAAGPAPSREPGRAPDPGPANSDPYAGDAPSMDDPDAEATDQIGLPAILKVLGGTVIEQVDDEEG